MKVDKRILRGTENNKIMDITMQNRIGKCFIRIRLSRFRFHV